MDLQSLIKRVQASLNLEVDGVAGPATWQAIADKLAPLPKELPRVSVAKTGSLAKKLVEFAREEVGVEEVDGTNCGPRVNAYKAATTLDPNASWPWCAAFICWLFREAMKNSKHSFSRPTTASAWGFEDWARGENDSIKLQKPINNDIKSGDIVVFTFSHIGLAISGIDSSGYIQTIEGNTDGIGSREGGAVLQKKRHISQIRSRIRTFE
jgi:hypothetical protein